MWYQASSLAIIRWTDVGNMKHDITLFYGDCLDQMKHIKSNTIDLILTDPPYGTTACKWDTIIPLDKMWAQIKRVLKNKGAAVLFGAEPFSSYLRLSNIKEFKYDWTWNKVNGIRNHLNAKKQPLRVTELISVFYRSQCLYTPIMREGNYRTRKTTSGQSETFGKVYATNSGNNVTEMYPLNLIHFNSHDPNNNIHPTQKPVELLEYLLKTYTKKGDIVLDLAMGSGSTGVACVNTGRSFIGIELVEQYFKMACERIYGINTK